MRQRAEYVFCWGKTILMYVYIIPCCCKTTATAFIRLQESGQISRVSLCSVLITGGASSTGCGWAAATREQEARRALTSLPLEERRPVRHQTRFARVFESGD